MFFFFSSRRRHTRFDCDWSSDVCSSDRFAIMLDWWAKQNASNRALYAGMIPGNVRDGNWPADEPIAQIYVTRAHPGAHGHVHFSMRSLMPNSAFTPIAGADTISQARLDSMN